MYDIGPKRQRLLLIIQTSVPISTIKDLLAILKTYIFSTVPPVISLKHYIIWGKII